jgi:hypothetical protein
MGDFVRPEPIRLSLSGGHYIDIKKRLNHGEREDMYARIAPYVVPGEPVQMNRREVRTAYVLTYLLGWSLVMTKGHRWPSRPCCRKRTVSTRFAASTRIASTRSTSPLRSTKRRTRKNWQKKRRARLP